jgi:hypothetical protein
LYLRAGDELHLLEVKKPTEDTQWLNAADQIARQWGKTAHWLRKRNDKVFLWAVCPVRWSRSKRIAKVPPNWGVQLEAIKAQRLVGSAAAELGLLFYGIFRSNDGLRLYLWRADEPAPSLEIR